jgi:hypothetical protein
VARTRRRVVKRAEIGTTPETAFELVRAAHRIAHDEHLAKDEPPRNHRYQQQQRQYQLHQHAGIADQADQRQVLGYVHGCLQSS